jgi:hypothetical protein
MSYTADAGKSPIERQVSGEIGRWPQCAFDDASSKVRHNHIYGLHPVIGNTARLDDHQAVVAADAARVPERVNHQTTANQFQVGFKDFFAE